MLNTWDFTILLLLLWCTSIPILTFSINMRNKIFKNSIQHYSFRAHHSDGKKTKIPQVSPFHGIQCILTRWNKIVEEIKTTICAHLPCGLDVKPSFTHSSFLHLLWKLKHFIAKAKVTAKTKQKPTTAIPAAPKKSCRYPNWSSSNFFTGTDWTPSASFTSSFISPYWDVRRPYKLHDIGFAQ